jgi:hypothetical protein
MINTYKVLGGKPKGKRSIGRLRSVWEDYIKVNTEYMD